MQFIRWPAALSSASRAMLRVFSCYSRSSRLGGMRKIEERQEAPGGSLQAALATLPDVRRGQGKVHPLDGMVALAVCALVCGSRRLDAMSQWGKDCGPEIRTALGLRVERGPSVATLHRAFRALDHAAFEQVLTAWFAGQGLVRDEALAIEGKTLRGIHAASMRHPWAGDPRRPPGRGLRPPDTGDTDTSRDAGQRA
jgi:hypothetical protein